jgi:large subunit ribosomal protein L17
MRHGNYRGQLGVHPGHRRAMIRNLVTALLKNERIRTTRAKARETRRYAEKMITMAKKDTLAAKRKALGFIREREVVNKLFKTLIYRYAQRSGGYTRVLKLGPRPGDAAEMVFLDLVDRPVEVAPAPDTKKEKAAKDSKEGASETELKAKGKKKAKEAAASGTKA